MIKLLLVSAALIFSDIFIFFKLYQFAGIMTVIILIVAPGLLGLAMIVSQGLSAFGRIRTAYRQKKISGIQFSDSIMIFLGGWLLMLPGLISGILGLSTLLSKIRNVYWDLLICKIINKIFRGKFGFHIR